MHHIMVTGAGKIGSLIACLLADSDDYQVHLADLDFSGTDVTRVLQILPEIKTVALDVNDQQAILSYVEKHKITAIISSLPYFLNTHVAQIAKLANAHYFDLAEDTAVTAVIKAIASDAGTAFVPQCGLAPGFVGIVANHLMQGFEPCYQAKLRVGALPQHVSNTLNYALTWSTDGFINECGNPCSGIEAGRVVTLAPLEGLEAIQMEGCEFEAFNTSGGIGSLVEIYDGKVSHLNYKTIRYPGHCEKMRFLMNDLRLNEDRECLKRILQRAIPKTTQDMVVIYVSVDGVQQGEFIEKNYVKKMFPKTIRGLEWSAIQVSTASGICAVVDLVLARPKEYTGIVLQEQFALNDILSNRFGQFFS